MANTLNSKRNIHWCRPWLTHVSSSCWRRRCNARTNKDCEWLWCDGGGRKVNSTEGFSLWYSQRLHGLLHHMNLLTYAFVLPTCVNAFTAHLEIDSERPADGWWGAMKYHEVTHESCQEDFLCGSMAWQHPGGHGTFEAKLASLSGGNIIICKIPLANYYF